MSEIISEQQIESTEAISSSLGKITILEALATEAGSVSPDSMGRTTMQGSVDFDD